MNYSMVKECLSLVIRLTLNSPSKSPSVESLITTVAPRGNGNSKISITTGSVGGEGNIVEIAPAVAAAKNVRRFIFISDLVGSLA